MILVDRGIHAIRRVMNDLRPAMLDDLGLAAAIRTLADDVQGRGTLQVRVDAPARRPRLHAEAELALFRAAQEALANVIRHARATEARITLSAERGAVRLSVHDNGRGFTVVDRAPVSGNAQAGLGGMRERILAVGGTFAIEGSHGTMLRVTVPVGVGDA